MHVIMLCYVCMYVFTICMIRFQYIISNSKHFLQSLLLALRLSCHLCVTLTELGYVVFHVLYLFKIQNDKIFENLKFKNNQKDLT